MLENNERKKYSNTEIELYILIAKFLSTGPCKGTAELLKKEIEEHELLPKRVDWLGNEHTRSFNELEHILSQVADDHLLKICSRIGPILDNEIPPTVKGLTSLLGVGRQSLLRTKEELLKPKNQTSNLIARKNGMPFLPSYAFQSAYPPNIAQVLVSRELSGSLSRTHTFKPNVYARIQSYRRLLGHLSSVYCVLFDRTGKYIFTGADDLLVKIWNATDGRLLAALRGHSAEITDMAVNHENTLLAAGSCDKTIRVWYLRSLAPVAVLSGHTGMVTSLQFCPYPKNADRLLISTGNDGCVCFWFWNPQSNVFNPKPIKFTERNKANAQMICSSFSAGGMFLATGSTDNNVRVYNIAGLTGPEKILEREIHTDRVDSIQFSNRDCRFISGSKDGTALIWKYDRQSWSTIQLKMSTKLPGQSEEREDTKIKLMVTMVSWTLDDEKVITAVSDRSIKVWNSYSGNLVFVLKGHEDEVFVLEPHPTDPRVFLSSGHDGRIILWDLITGTIIKNHFNLIEGQGHGAVFDCKFSPDGMMFASTDSHGHLSLFGFGAADRYKKVPEEQFFHTDYRPLIRDIHHHVLDEQTQTAPHLLPPPFLVDIDGNPYPPTVQRLVPGREHLNDSQLVPYVAVSAEGDSEILEPVRPADDERPDRPTIDDMIEILQHEQDQHMDHDRNNNNNGNISPRVPVDPNRSPNSSQRSVNGSEDHNGAEPFSPRTPRSQAGHSRVGLRRTGEHEGVQSVGNWQSRGSQADVPSWVKRVVVRPLESSLAKSRLKQRMILAENEINFFIKEKKRRPLPDRSEELSSQESNNLRFQRRTGMRAGLRSRTQEDIVNNAFGDEFANPDNVNSNSSSESETEQQEEMSDSTEESESEDYSDWSENVPSTLKPKPKPEPLPSTSSGTSRRPASLRPIKPRRRLVSSDEESEDENKANTSNDTSQTEVETPKKSKKKSPIKKKTAVNGKKLPERFRPPEWLTDVMPHKAPYVPQIGDEILYFRQGHELYVQAVKRNRIYDIYMRSQPWRKINLRDQEVARIEDITFENHPPRLCCLKLSLVNPAERCPESFVVKYHDMADVIDFIVLKQTYDQAMYYDWKPGDRFRSAIDKAWWLGTIKSQKPLNPNFPDSMFQCFLVKWDNGEKEHMSPWDFEPIDNDRLPEEEGGSVEITPEERMAMMYVPESDEWSVFGIDHDCDRIARGLTRIMELSIADSFVTPVDLNLYPSYAIVVEYPMDLGTIKARVQNRFYRRLEAIKFDIRYIEINALKFNEPGSRIVKQAKCVVDLCIRFIDSSHCSDPMILYNDMMEAKQSRSQDSQSELDVLCSEIDSDGDNNVSTRIKRKKQNALQQSSKRVRLANQKYTSCSWKQQCTSLITTFFQCDDSTPFRQPVNLNDYPDYRNIIDIPMDLSTVQERLNSNHYRSPIDFCKDMRLIFQNSRNYNTNKKSRIYSMTIRLSAMFEEHIRGIVSDWRSAVKYEEKIRNNQYVSNRRKPLPLLESDVNIGASTSRVTGVPSSRHDTSRHSRATLNTSHSEPSSSRSHVNRHTNGTGLKKKIKQEESQSSKGSSVRLKKKMLKPSIGASLTNGVRKAVPVQKRKIPDKSPKKNNERTQKKESYGEGLSQSDSSNYSSDNSKSDTDWNQSSKKRRKESSTNLHQKSLRSRNSGRPTRAYHQKSSIYSSSLRTHKRASLPIRAINSRSSHERRWVSMRERTVKSPLHKRSKRLCNATGRPASARTYRDSSDSFESDEASEPQSFKSEKNSNSSGSSSKSSFTKNKTQPIEGSSKSQQYESSSESEPSDEGLRPELPRRTTRVAARGAKVSALSAHLTNSQRKFGRMVTRNRGVRTVKYQEGNSDDSENDESMQSFNSRSSLRSLSNDGEQNPGIRKRTAEKTIENEEGFASRASSFAHEKHSSSRDSSNPSAAYGASSYSKSNSNIRVSKLHRSLKSTRIGRPYKGYLKSIPLRTRSAMNKSSKAYNRNRIKNISANKEDSLDTNGNAHLAITNKANKFHVTSSYSLRTKLIKRSVYQRRPYSSLVYQQNNASLSNPTPFRRRRRPSFIRNASETELINTSNRRVENRASSELAVGTKGKLNKIRTRKYSPISLNTRSKLNLASEKTSTNSEDSPPKRIKPTIVFCKPSVSTSESDSKCRVRTFHFGSNNSDSKEKDVSVRNNNSLVENSLPSNSNRISFHTRSSENTSENQKDIKKQFSNSIAIKKFHSATRLENFKSDTLKSHRVKIYSPDSSGNKETSSPPNNEKIKENSSDSLESNKSKWCLRKPCLTTRISARISQNVGHSNEAHSSKIQTRNRGQRTVTYNEDIDNNYLTEILENEDPVKLSHQQDSNQSNPKESSNPTISDNTKNTLKKPDFSDKCSRRQATFLRPKKEALKILSNGIETRNHGQRTTIYAEDGDDYLEEYFENLETGL